MTDLAPAPTGEATDAVATRPGARGLLRRHRTSLVIALFLLLAVAVAVLTRDGDVGFEADHDPGNAGADGARAVARVLGGQGVDVEVVRTADDLAAATPGAGTTVVVTSTEQLGDSTLARLRNDTAGARVVLVDPGAGLLDALGLTGRRGEADTDGPVAAGCDDPRFAGLSIGVDDARRMPVDGATSACFDDTLVAVDGLELLGAPGLLTNDQVLRADNAAVALRVLGQDDRLVWYVATYDDLVGDDGVDFWSLVPDWVRPGLVLLALGLLALVLWRGRRLGPLATEPLPVVVRAVETTRSRGRLYRRAGDRAHAAAILRTASRDRLRARLSLGPVADHAVVREVARHLGRTEAEVGALLGAPGHPPATDHDLITLAADLAALEEEVRRS